jgi:hypothetical protein
LKRVGPFDKQSRGMLFEWDVNSCNLFVEVLKSNTVSSRPPSWLYLPCDSVEDLQSQIMDYLTADEESSPGRHEDIFLGPLLLTDLPSLLFRLFRLIHDKFIQEVMRKLPGISRLSRIGLMEDSNATRVMVMGIEPPCKPKRPVFA